MDNFLLYIFIGLVLFYFLTRQTVEKFENIRFLPYKSLPYSSWPVWWPWNQPTRLPRLFYDIRGDPNLLYRYHMLGGYSPYGYVFGPYLYDSQGNLIYDSNKSYYIN